MRARQDPRAPRQKTRTSARRHSTHAVGARVDHEEGAVTRVHCNTKWFVETNGPIAIGSPCRTCARFRIACRHTKRARKSTENRNKIEIKCTSARANTQKQTRALGLAPKKKRRRAHTSTSRHSTHCVGASVDHENSAVVGVNCNAPWTVEPSGPCAIADST